MGYDVLSSRAVIGMIWQALEESRDESWIGATSIMVESDQASEQYSGLGNVPKMREWIGQRNIKTLRDFTQTVENLHFESSIEIPLTWLRRDKTGQMQQRIGELAAADREHWFDLLTELINNGHQQACYDGQFFFDTDHVVGDSGTMDNDITIDISTLPAQVHGTVSDPSPEEMKRSILRAVKQLMTFKDDRGRSINKTARSFTIMLPVDLWEAGVEGVINPDVRGDRNILQNLPGFSFEPVANPDLSAADTFFVFRNDGTQKAFIRQSETEADIKAKAEGSDFEFDNDAHQYGIDAWRNAAYGSWETAVRAQLI